MIRRDTYLQRLIDNKDNGFPKVITGNSSAVYKINRSLISWLEKKKSITR